MAVTPTNAVSLQTGIRDYAGDLTDYTGMLGGLTPDIHTLRSLSPETTNRTICVMYRGPWFLMHYFGSGNNAYSNRPFATYKKMIEYYNTAINISGVEGTLASVPLQGGFAGRSINIPTVQNTQSQQQLQITVPELQGRPIANFHNMWVDGISDPVTGLTHYQGLVAGSVDANGSPQRIFKNIKEDGQNPMALEPSMAWEVAEFLLIALDRSGARVEGALMALGCIPAGKVGFDIFGQNPTGGSTIQSLTLTFNCQFIQSAFVNDLAARYVRKFAVFGNSLNLNPGAGDAFFKTARSADIDSVMFNEGNRPYLDGVQSGVGNAPVFKADQQAIQRQRLDQHAIKPSDHSLIYTNGAGATQSFPDWTKNGSVTPTGQTGE